MSLASNRAANPPRPGRERQWTAVSDARARRGITPDAIARRRMLVMLGKLLLPVLALALLTMMAVWPELDRATEQARVAFRRFTSTVEGASMRDARYHGVDERGRPYTVTADRARQTDPNRIVLVEPKGDMALEHDGWLMMQAHDGVYLQHSNQLDLAHDVILYRADGMTLRTESMAIDTKAGAAAGSEDVHVEGPLGTLEAHGFVLFDKGAVIQFTGPARAVVNGAQP